MNLEDYYRVIQIIDENTILINYGATDGAEEGDKVRIIAIGPEIYDPLTNDLLGSLDSIKSSLSIVTTYEKFSICKEIRKTKSSIFISPIDQFTTTTIDILPLNVDENEISNIEPPSDKVIRIGDIIELL